MKRNSYKIRSIVLLFLLIIGVYITKKDFVSITKLQVFLIVIYTFILFWIAVISSRMFFDFRYLYKMIKVRDSIYNLLKKHMEDKYARMVSEKIVRGDISLIRKLKFRGNIKKEILIQLDSIAKYKKFYR
ncbi:hypothetical protein M1145_02180 [Patescibacteria group bacterium]|nr:hypothetical protein [Patescibacteria group bacterium]